MPPSFDADSWWDLANMTIWVTVTGAVVLAGQWFTRRGDRSDRKKIVGAVTETRAAAQQAATNSAETRAQVQNGHHSKYRDDFDDLVTAVENLTSLVTSQIHLVSEQGRDIIGVRESIGGIHGDIRGLHSDVRGIREAHRALEQRLGRTGNG